MNYFILSVSETFKSSLSQLLIIYSGSMNVISQAESPYVGSNSVPPVSVF